MAHTKDETIQEVTTDYLDGIDADNPPTPEIINVPETLF